MSSQSGKLFSSICLAGTILTCSAVAKAQASEIAGDAVVPPTASAVSSSSASASPALEAGISATPVPAARSDLPDAPSAVLMAAADASPLLPQDAYNPKQRSSSPHVAAIYTKYIPAGWTAQPLTAHDKVILGLRDLYAPLSLLGDVLSASYSDITDGQPNYGTNRTAFGKRLGATFARDTSEGLFTDAIFAPLLREDPRYYVEGPSHNFIQRIAYAGTRTIITRTDSGSSSVNGAELLGYAGASALSYTYYPQINRNFKDTALTFGGGLGGSAIGFIVSEFSDEVLQALHLEKRD